jgi:topoisomerase IA-like protein
LPKTTAIEKLSKAEAVKMIEAKTPKKKAPKKKTTKKKNTDKKAAKKERINLYLANKKNNYEFRLFIPCKRIGFGAFGAAFFR